MLKINGRFYHGLQALLGWTVANGALIATIAGALPVKIGGPVVAIASAVAALSKPPSAAKPGE